MKGDFLCCELQKRRNGEDNEAEASEDNISHEEDKVFVVVISDTLTNPNTMMIHAKNTFLTDLAVMSTVWFDVSVRTVTTYILLILI